MGSSHVADGEPDPFARKPSDPQPCIYCGTDLDDDGRQAFGEQRMHSVEQCREYVKAALMGTHRACAVYRDALAQIGKNTCGREPLAAAFARGILEENR